AFHPREVRRGDVLIVAKQERIPGVVVAQVVPTCDIEEWITTLKPVWSVGSWDFQNAQPERSINIEGLRTQSLSRITDVAVQNNRWAKVVRPPDSNHINQSGGCTKLSSVEGTTADFSKY